MYFNIRPISCSLVKLIYGKPAGLQAAIEAVELGQVNLYN
jgi:hypothetical protein